MIGSFIHRVLPLAWFLLACVCVSAIRICEDLSDLSCLPPFRVGTYKVRYLCMYIGKNTIYPNTPLPTCYLPIVPASSLFLCFFLSFPFLLLLQLCVRVLFTYGEVHVYQVGS